MTVIELGDVTPGSPLPSAVASPGYDHRAVRRFVLAAIAVLCLLGLTGSVRPQSTLLRTLWSVPFGLADRFTVTSSALYAATVATHGRLTAYDLDTGAVRWSAGTPQGDAWPLAAAAGVLLFPADRVAHEIDSPDGTSYLAEFYRQTVAVDERTGAPLWRLPGETFTTGGRAALLVDRAGEQGDMFAAIRLVGLRDGGVRWAAATPGTARLAVGGADPKNPDLLATVTATGDAEVRRMADGSRVAAGHIDLRTVSPENGEFVELFLDARRLYVRMSTGRGDSLAAYSVDTLRPVWRQEDTARVAAYACGAVLCSVLNPGMLAFDPATGREVWSSPRTQNVWPAGPGRLLSDEGTDAYALLDEATGRRIAGLGPGRPVPDVDGTIGYLVRDTSAPPYQAVVSRIDLATGEVGLRGTIPRISSDYGCQGTADRLACPTVDGRLLVVGVG